MGSVLADRTRSICRAWGRWRTSRYHRPPAYSRREPLGTGGRADHGPGTRTVFNHDALAEALRQTRRQRARKRINMPPAGQGAIRVTAVWIVLRSNHRSERKT